MASKRASSKVVVDSQKSVQGRSRGLSCKSRLGYALRALGRSSNAEAVLDSVPFSDAKKNNRPKPGMFLGYP
jgi:hypothetical protein